MFLLLGKLDGCALLVTFALCPVTSLVTIATLGVGRGGGELPHCQVVTQFLTSSSECCGTHAPVESTNALTILSSREPSRAVLSRRLCAVSRKVMVSIPVEIIGYLGYSRPLALGSPHPVAEMSPRNHAGGKGRHHL
jgi:hypothetical protein